MLINVPKLEGFERLTFWTSFVRQHLKDAVIVLVATKEDMQPHLITEDVLREISAQFDHRSPHQEDNTALVSNRERATGTNNGL
jgi:hypothetical protein